MLNIENQQKKVIKLNLYVENASKKVNNATKQRKKRIL